MNIAPSGQKPTHIKQPTQAFLSILTMPFLSLFIACTGQMSMHIPHCEHADISGLPSFSTTFRQAFSAASSLKYNFEQVFSQT